MKVVYGVRESNGKVVAKGFSCKEEAKVVRNKLQGELPKMRDNHNLWSYLVTRVYND